TLAPWLDQTNRRALRRFEYQQPPRQSPIRFALGIAVLVFIGTLFVAAYFDELGLSLGQIWGIVLGVPIVLGAVTYMWVDRSGPSERFDPTSADTPVVRSPVIDRTALPPPSVPMPAATTTPLVAEEPPVRPEPAQPGPAIAPRPRPVVSVDPTSRLTRTGAARGDRARDALVAALNECADLAPAVEQLEGADLLEILEYIDSLRLGLTESSQVLQGVVRGHEATRSE
ncbi:MAG: hypothetical protein ACRDJ9_27425, partial [Dehalococcoidia bacterium]